MTAEMEETINRLLAALEIENATARDFNDVAAAIQSAVDAERRRLIPLVCDKCAKGFSEERSLWRGEYVRFHLQGRYRCPASPIYEAIRADSLEDDNP